MEIVTLVAAKFKVERDATAYKEDATIAHTMFRDMSMAAEQKLIRAVEHAKVEAKRETLEELEARGFKLSADLEEARAEGRFALLISPDKGEDDSGEECRESFQSEDEFPKVGGEITGPRAFARLKAELLHCEAPLRDARDREKSLKLLCAAKESELVSLCHEVDRSQAREALLEKQEHVNAYSEAKERAQAGAFALEAQIQAARENDSVRAKMILRLSSEISRAKTEVVNVRAKVVMNKTRAGQKMAAYSRSTATAKAELKKTLDRNNIKEYERCRSRREIFEEIHGRGFDLSGEIKQAKGEEYDAKFLLSDV
ncbi:uncharacterized protein At3g49055-like [Nicotiana sylvestris]|uniref:uncharacterized protein At3g49055-like n=1 Tax=Nicotiana sylvestris TaxID=4096 RepID=UPI00388C6D57